MTDNQKENTKSRKWNSDFYKYTEFIVNHDNYNGLYFERRKDGKVKWVVAGKSDNGRKRREWWEMQCKNYGLKIEAGVYAKIASIIHPTKVHVCQICGKSLSINYVYPNKRTIKSFEDYFSASILPFQDDIFKLIDDLVVLEEDMQEVKRIFKINPNLKLDKIKLKEYILINYVEACSKSYLSPGVMSNSPDRFDGFHSDGACCRANSDKGRHTLNLQRYSQDRRAYECWADGNWKMADRLMALFSTKGLSADHIGPLSLGFCHRPKFQPLTASQNSAKNNRMSLNDVRILIEDEINGDQVVSWHSQFIWDKLKSKVTNDEEAIKLSGIMRRNMNYVFIVLSIIDEAGYSEFLKSYLNPQYSYYDYKFINFNAEKGTYDNVVTRSLQGQNQINNAERYIRISFEALAMYKIKENRRSKIWKSKVIDDKIILLLAGLKEGNFSDAKKKLSEIFYQLAQLDGMDF